MSKDWKSFYEARTGAGPHNLLKEAVLLVHEKERALDLGAGNGRDTQFLLHEGFSVDAVDASEEAKEYIPKEAHFIQSMFDEFDFPKNTYNLVNAEYALPFSALPTFSTMFSRLALSLKRDGIFTGQFFGPEDEWASDPTMSFHSRKEVERLLEPFVILKLEEEKRLGLTALQKEKFWHIFHVIAQKS